MSRLISILCVVSAIGIGMTAWFLLKDDADSLQIPSAPSTTERRNGQINTKPSSTETTTSAAQRLLESARTKCSLEALEPVIKQLQDQANESRSAETWHCLAEGFLARAMQRTHLMGMAPGKPTFSELPDDFANDLEAGLKAVKKAREHGDESGELYRIEASLMSQHIIGLGSALKWNGKISEALKTAGERQPNDPQLHVALGLRKLLAPTWLGNDPAKALEHFEFAVGATRDERPAVFAAMASHLQKKREVAIKWLEQAMQRNPNNKYARVVLKRLRDGEDDPFGRDVSEAEAQASK
jgi:tetratricopeptide (TPR) repeat protein